MATFSSVTKQHILQAIAECDSRGTEEFLELYGFGPSQGYPLIHEGRSYDSKAILGVAHRFATGRLATSEEFSGDIDGAFAILRKRGFEVPEPAAATRTTPQRATAKRTTAARTTAARAPRAAATPRATTAPRPKSAAARAAAARDTPPPICPTCLMTLPATGVCDDCS